MSKPAPKQRNTLVKKVADAHVIKVDWKRDVPINLPQSTRDQLDAASMLHTDVRKQLDILRKTRGTRDVGTLKVPVELSAGIPMSDAGVRKIQLTDGD